MISEELDLTDLSAMVIKGRKRAELKQWMCYDNSEACLSKAPPVPAVRSCRGKPGRHRCAAVHARMYVGNEPRRMAFSQQVERSSMLPSMLPQAGWAFVPSEPTTYLHGAAVLVACSLKPAMPTLSACIAGPQGGRGAHAAGRGRNPHRQDDAQDEDAGHVRHTV